MAAEGELLTPGGMFGDFKVVRELGEGGMGAVYLVEDAEAWFPFCEVARSGRLW